MMRLHSTQLSAACSMHPPVEAAHKDTDRLPVSGILTAHGERDRAGDLYAGRSPHSEVVQGAQAAGSSLGTPLSVWRMRRVAASRACSRDSLSSS